MNAVQRTLFLAVLLIGMNYGSFLIGVERGYRRAVDRLERPVPPPPGWLQRAADWLSDPAG